MLKTKFTLSVPYSVDEIIRILATKNSHDNADYRFDRNNPTQIKFIYFNFRGWEDIFRYSFGEADFTCKLKYVVESQDKTVLHVTQTQYYLPGRVRQFFIHKLNATLLSDKMFGIDFTRFS